MSAMTVEQAMSPYSYPHENTSPEAARLLGKKWATLSGEVIRLRTENTRLNGEVEKEKKQADVIRGRWRSASVGMEEAEAASKQKDLDLERTVDAGNQLASWASAVNPDGQKNTNDWNHGLWERIALWDRDKDALAPSLMKDARDEGKS